MRQVWDRFWATIDWLGRLQTLCVLAAIALAAFGFAWRYGGVDTSTSVLIATFVGGVAFLGACYVVAPLVDAASPETPPSIYSDRASLGLPPRDPNAPPLRPSRPGASPFENREALALPPLPDPPRPATPPTKTAPTGERLAAKIRNAVPATHSDWRRIKENSWPGSEPPTPRQWAIAAGNYASNKAHEKPAFSSTELPTAVYRDWEEKIRARLEKMAPAIALEFSVACSDYQRTQGPIDFTGLERHGPILAHDWLYAKGRWENAAKVLCKLAAKMDG